LLTADQFDVLADPITRLYAEYETSVIEDIARRLKNLDFASAAWQVRRVTESGAVYKNVLKELSRLTGKSEETIAAILKKAGVNAINFDDKIYKAAGLNPIPLNLSPAMLNVLVAGLNKTNGVLNNITMTTAVTAQQAFIKAADMAYMQVSTGAMSYDQAIRAAIKQVAADGLTTIDYASGHKDQLDVALRRTVLTGVSQTAGQIQTARADEVGSNLVQVSAHIGARNTGKGYDNHESWQGKIYSLKGGTKNYPNLVEATGYGTVTGLGGVNCRHSWYPFFEGLSEPAYTRKTLTEYKKETVRVGDKEIPVYEATQYQRGIERKIRYWKRQAAAMKAAKLDSTVEDAKISQWQRTMREFIAQTELQRQRMREVVLY